MTYVVKNTYEKSGADVLLEHMSGPIEIFSIPFSDPRIISQIWYRSDSREYAEFYMTWESEQSYKEWDYDHKVAHEAGKAAMEEWMKDSGIMFQRIYPDIDDPTITHQKFKDPRISPSNEITFEEIFK
jgi:hypothetical protein